MALLRPQVNLIKLSLNVSHYPKAVENISNLTLDPKWRWFVESECTASYIFRHQSGFVYQLFKKGHINLTGVRKVEDIERAISIIYNIIGIPKIIASDYRIDNIQASGALNLNSRHKSLKTICDNLNSVKDECNIKKLSFESQRFPGAFIRYADERCRGTVILFNSRRFVLVGVKSLEDINTIHNWLEISIWKAVSRQEASLPPADMTM